MVYFDSPWGITTATAGDFIIFWYDGYTDAYPVHGQIYNEGRINWPLVFRAMSWMPNECMPSPDGPLWAFVWAPSRSQAKKAATKLHQTWREHES